MINQIMPVINFVLIVVICVIAISNFVFLHKHRDDKSKLINEISDIYPLVKPKFYTKTLARQTVENNQEIQEINERLEAIEKKLGIE
jgi:glycerol-3-phosphate O-acyltransferase